MAIGELSSVSGMGYSDAALVPYRYEFRNGYEMISSRSPDHVNARNEHLYQTQEQVPKINRSLIQLEPIITRAKKSN